MGHLRNIFPAMQKDEHGRVLGAIQLILRPIIKILLRYGISFADFAEVAKTVFVDVSSSDFGIRGRPTNISRIAVMSGLTRKEVRRLRSKIEEGEETVSVKSTPSTEILTRWHSEEDFLNERGRPRLLNFSEGPNSFTDLVKRFGGDVPPGAMRTELKRIGVVEELKDGRLKAVSRVILPPDSTENLMTSLVHNAYPLLSTIATNTDPDKVPGEGFAQFATYSLCISKSDRKRLRRISYDRLSEAAVSFDDLFTAYESIADNDAESNEGVVMVGLYYFEETDRSAKYKW